MLRRLKAPAIRSTASLVEALGAYADAADGARPIADTFRELRSLADGIRAAFSLEPVVPVVHTLPLVEGPVPASLALGAAVRTRVPFVVVRHRALLVQYFLEGEPRTLLWNPTDVPRALRVRALDPLRQGVGRFAATFALRTFAAVDSQLGALGVSPDSVDLLLFDQLDGQDPAAALARFPRARVLLASREWTRFHDPPAKDRGFILRGPELSPDRVDRYEHGLKLGDGIALVRTGGRHDGHQCLVVRTSLGVLVASGNALAIDGYAPRASRLPGLSEHARNANVDFVPAFPSVGGHAAEAMAIEYSLADRLPDAPVWPFVLPSLELIRSKIAPGIRPSASAPDLSLGTISRTRVRRR